MENKSYDEYLIQRAKLKENSALESAMYIVQRGTFQKFDLANTHQFITGTDGLIDLDYMGAAEYEFGAVPYSMRHIMDKFEDYSLNASNIKSFHGLPLYIFCRKDLYESIVKEIQFFIDYNDPHSIAYYQLHEFISLPKHVYPYYAEPSHAKFYSSRDDFWWDLKNDFMFFFGDTNRRKAFMNAINCDYNEWWIGMHTVEERSKLLEVAQHRF